MDVAAIQEGSQTQGVDVPLHEAGAVERNPGDAYRGGKRP